MRHYPTRPLRALCYLAKEYEKLTYSKSIYSKRLVKIPTPELYVFYNGTQDAPLEQELKLSDAFEEKCDKLFVEAVVKMINVNYDKGAEVLKKCQELREYSQLIHMIRQRLKEGLDLHTAITECVISCSKQGILQEFLQRNGGEVMSFLFDALTREECEAIREEDGYERGMREGIEKGELRGRREGLSQGELKGKRDGKLLGIIEDNLEDGKSQEQIFAKLQKRYGLSEEECSKYFEQFQINNEKNK